ncbi:MAG TPA: TetR/AcrR family transcriptional regulator [Phototrophicaceae bacterium]|nr:TetR/AcrR family transcriptional regulator [Phototrophicaceae bacterium]
MKTPTPSASQIQRVLATAADLIAHYGFDKTTMEDIARQAGMSKSALYLLWSSKNQLFDALLASEMRRLLQDFQTRMEGDPAGGQIANLYRHALLALQANPLMCALYTRDARVLGDFVSRQDAERYTSRLLLSVEAIARMQAAGLIQADLRPEVIAYVFSIIAVGFIHIQAIVPTAEAPPLAEIAQAISHLMQSGLAGTAGDSTAGQQAISTLVAFAIQQYDDELAKTKR